MGGIQDVQKGLDLFKTLVFDNTIEALLLEYLGPVLAIPLLGPILRALILKFTDKVYERLNGVVMMQTVLFVTKQNREAFDEAGIELKRIALTKGIDSSEFKVAHDKEKLALKKLIQFDIARA